MAFDQDTAETLAPVLAMIGKEARLDPLWTCRMLDAVTEHMLREYHRQQRDTVASNAERISHGLKLASSPTATVDDLVKLAHAYAGEERLVDALYWITKAIAARPDDGEFQRFKASILERTGSFEEALRVAHEAKLNGAELDAISDDISRIRTRLVSLLWENARSDDATQSLTSYVKLLQMRNLRLSNFLKFLAKAVSAYVQRK